MRPCWIVVAPGTAKKLESTIRHLAPDPDEPWEVVDGKGHVAIIETEPGSEGANDDALAKALTAKVKKPAYVLWLDDEMPRVQAFEGGEPKGEVNASPDDVLFTLGFRFDWMRRGEKVTLRVEPPLAKVKQGEAMIWQWSVSQWQQMMRRGGDWHILLDGAGPATIDQVCAICDDASVDVRLLGATMLSHIGYYSLASSDRLEQGLATLATLAQDRSTKVRDVAIEARATIVERGEYESVREQFPWLLNYDEQYVTEALTLLDEDRPLVHRYIYPWFSQGAWNNNGLPKAVVAKLKTLAKTVPEAKALIDELRAIRA